MPLSPVWTTCGFPGTACWIWPRTLIDRGKACSSTRCKYATWSQEIKNIHDGFPNLQLVFTGSSLLELHKGKADLSRRARMYDMRGLSFREFLEYDQGTQFPALALSSILDNSSKLSIEIVERIKPIPAFQDYLRHGYYPFYKEDVRGFHSRLANVANLILESDLPAVESIEVHTIPKIKKLLWLISKSVPFTPNISALSQQVGVSRNSLLNYLSWLERAGLVRLLPLKGGGFNVLAKPEKIYLDNTNFIHAFEPQQPNLGNERETFFFNQVSSVAKVTAAKRGDFLLDDAITVEVGGRNKTPSQLPDASSSYLALDNIEYGSGNRIPSGSSDFSISRPTPFRLRRHESTRVDARRRKSSSIPSNPVDLGRLLRFPLE